MSGQMTSRSASSGKGTDRQPSAMRDVRRLYVYGVTAATLLIISIGAVLLLSLGLDKLFTAISGAEWIHGGPDWERQRLSISIPLIMIAAPIWWLHWRMAQRALHGREGDAERHALIRSLYFAVVFLITGLWVALNVVSGLALVLGRAFGGALDQSQRGSIVITTAILAVAVIVWTFHLLSYVRDIPAMDAEQRSDLPVQVSFYFASAIGGIVALFGVSDLIRLALRAVLNENGPGRWWRDSLSNALALTVTFGVVWAINWLSARRLTAASTWWGKSHAGASARRLYLVSGPLVTGFVALIYFAQGIEGLVRLVLDEPLHGGDARAFTILNPLLYAMPFVLSWIIHRYLFLQEPDQPGDPIRLATVKRLFEYVIASLGLLLASAGAALLIAEMVKRVAGLGDWQANIGWPIGLALGGGALWIWYWQRVRYRFGRDQRAEQNSTTRRAYLFVALGGALVAFVVSLAMTVYQVMQKLLDVAGAPLATSIALPLGVTAVTAVVAVYHLVLLRRDLPVRGLIEREEQVSPARMDLMLTGPTGVDLRDVVAMLQRSLPEGYAIEPSSTGTNEASKRSDAKPLSMHPVRAERG